MILSGTHCILIVCFYIHVFVIVDVQGMFGIGKSTAKFINKETNIQSKFRFV